MILWFLSSTITVHIITSIICIITTVSFIVWSIFVSKERPPGQWALTYGFG